MTQRAAMVAGATGLVGSYCLRHLLNHPGYSEVIALLRKPLPDTHPKLIQQIVDFERLPQPELRPADVFCALGTTIAKAGSQEAFRKVDLEYPRLLAQKAAEWGARIIAVVSSVGADPRSSNFYLRTKGEMEDAVAGSGIESIHIFRPSFLTGPRREFRLGEKAGAGIARLLGFAFVGGLTKYRPIAAETVARAMIAAADGHPAGRCIYHYSDIVRAAHR